MLIGRSSNIRQSNVGIIRKYSNNRYKLSHLKSMRIAGFEPVGEEKSLVKPRGTVNDYKLDNSLSRSRTKIYELALCNSWSYFVTLTFSPEKVDRYNLHNTYKQFSKWINNYNSRRNDNVKYMLVPEPHKDGAWHLHGLLSGLTCNLQPFSVDDNIPYRIKNMIRAGRQIYNWCEYADKFGYITLEPIIDTERCAKYMMKYITKALGQSSIALNHHLYYCSMGLKRSQIIFKGEIKRQIELPDFRNDYVTNKWFSSEEEAAKYFCDEV